MSVSTSSQPSADAVIPKKGCGLSLTEQDGTSQRTRVDWRPAFLSALEETGVVKRAAECADVGRTTVWTERQNNKDFAKQYQDSLRAGALLLEAEAIRRASEGLIRKKFTKGGAPIIDPSTGEQYVEREYSDTLLALLLKRHMPDEYRDKPTETHVSTSVQTFLVLTPEKAKQLQDRMRAIDQELLASKVNAIART